MTNSLSEFLDVAEIWAHVRFPWACEFTYKVIRNQVYRLHKFMKDRDGNEEEFIRIIRERRVRMESDLKLNVDQYLFFSEAILCVGCRAELKEAWRFCPE